jgi:hypothetical protein
METITQAVDGEVARLLCPESTRRIGTDSMSVYEDAEARQTK